MKTLFRVTIFCLMSLSILSDKCRILDCTLDVVDTEPCYINYEKNDEYDEKIAIRQCKPGYYCLLAVVNENKQSFCTKIPEQLKNTTLVEDYYYNQDKYSKEEVMTNNLHLISYSNFYIKYSFFFWENSYPGEKCNKNSNCKSKNCVNNICSGISEGNQCEKTSLCDVNLYCKNNVCTKLQKEGDACEIETDCDYTCGCLNKKCTKYYSLPDKTKISNYKHRRFCKTGFLRVLKLSPSVCDIPLNAPISAVIGGDCFGEFQCDSISLTSEKCSNNQDKCTYSYGSDSSLLVENCRCDAIKSDGSKFCSSKSVVQEFYGFNLIDDTENMLIMPNENRHTMSRFEGTFEDEMLKKLEDNNFNCIRRSFMGELVDIYEKKTDGVDIINSSSSFLFKIPYTIYIIVILQLIQ